MRLDELMPNRRYKWCYDVTPTTRVYTKISKPSWLCTVFLDAKTYDFSYDAGPNEEIRGWYENIYDEESFKENDSHFSELVKKLTEGL